jgi:hypothetical protein
MILSEKINYLKKCYEEKKMDEYYSSNKDLILTSEEALKLYKDNENIGVSKSTVYFLLADSDKRKYISDIKQFDSIDECSFYYCFGDRSLKMEILENIFNSGFITKENFRYFIEYIGRDNYGMRFKILSELIRNDCNNAESSILYQINILPEPYKVKLLNYIIDNSSEQKRITSLCDIVFNVKDEDEKIVLLNKLMSNNFFADSEIVAKLNYEKIVKSLSADKRKKIIYSYLTDVKENNGVVAVEYILSLLSIDDILQFIKENNIEIRMDVLACAIDPKDWKKLYDFVVSSKSNSEKYISRSFFIPAQNQYSESDFLNVIIKDFLSRDEVSIDTKCYVIERLFKVEEKYDVIDILVGFEGQNLSSESFNSLIYNTFGYQCDLGPYPNIRKYIEQKYKIKNIDNLNKYFKEFGSTGLFYFQSENIVNIINLDNDSYDRIMAIFNENNAKLNGDVINTVTNALLQRKFRIEQIDDYNIFPRFETLIETKNDNSVKEVKRLLEKINETIDIAEIVDGRVLDIDALFMHKADEINMLHAITSAYIAKKREQYVTENLQDALSALNVGRYYNKVYIKKNFILLNDDKRIRRTIEHAMLITSEWNEKEKSLFMDEERLSKVLDFKRYGGKSSEIKEDLIVFEGILTKLYELKLLRLKKDPADAKYEYDIPSFDKNKILPILAEINPARLQKGVLVNESLYNKLNGLFSKYKILGWSDVFETFGETADLEMNVFMVTSIMNNFDKIDEIMTQLPKKNQTLVSLLDCANAHSGSSKKYPILINRENFNFIATNPGPNISSFAKNARIKEIPYYVRKMYERDSITIPSGEKDFVVAGDKRIKVSIGDIYNPIAMTYGERTGACLRIKGVYDDLFAYCLTNKNGFHIRFTNPDGGGLISRVSGIRNGNTLFLNELRYSLDEGYSSEDLIECLNQIAKYLVEITRNDPNPIENVIVSNAYAMMDTSEDNLKVRDRKKAFNGLHFDIKDTGNILYTANDNPKQLMPYKFGDEHASEYKPYNTYMSVAGSAYAEEIVNRVYFINELLKGKNIDDIDLIKVDNVKKCIYGHGWAIYQDENDRLHQIIIDKFKNDEEILALIEAGKNKYFGEIIDNKRK